MSQLSMCEPSCRPFGVPLRERIRTFLANWKHRHTRRAYRHIAKAMRDDPGYRHSWLCNIAMPIYDATRPKCVCQSLIGPPFPNSGHFPECQVRQAETIPRRFECREMSIEQANYIAERLIKHLFDV